MQLRVEGFDVDFAKPTRAHDLRDPFGVVLVSLVHLHRESRFGMPRVDAHNGDPKSLKSVEVPNAQRPGLESNA